MDLGICRMNDPAVSLQTTLDFMSLCPPISNSRAGDWRRLRRPVADELLGLVPGAESAPPSS